MSAHTMPRPRPARSQGDPIGSLKEAFPLGFDPMPAQYRDLLQRNCLRGKQPAVLKLASELTVERPAPVVTDDLPFRWVQLTPALVAAYTHCAETENRLLLKDLVDSGILDRHKDGKNTFAGFYRMRPDRWPQVAPYAERDLAIAQKERLEELERARKKKAAQDAANFADPVETPLRAPAPAPRPTPPQVIMPGKSHTVPLNVAIRGTRIESALDDFLYEYSLEDGWLIQRLCLTPQAQEAKEKRTRPCYSTAPQPSSASCESIAKAKEKRTLPCYSTGDSAQVLAIQPTDLAELRNSLQPIAQRYWGRPVDSDMLCRLCDILDGTPLDMFLLVVNSRLDSSAKLKIGILLNLAADAKRVRLEALALEEDRRKRAAAQRLIALSARAQQWFEDPAGASTYDCVLASHEWDEIDAAARDLGVPQSRRDEVRAIVLERAWKAEQQ